MGLCYFSFWRESRSSVFCGYKSDWGPKSGGIGRQTGAEIIWEDLWSVHWGGPAKTKKLTATKMQRKE